jgi:hypothetical protein
MLRLSINLRLAINTLVFIALSVFAFEPTALKDRADHRAEAGSQELGKSPICALASFPGKVGIRKAQGLHTPDLLLMVAQEGAIKTKLRFCPAEFFAGADPCCLDLRNSRGRAPPAA